MEEAAWGAAKVRVTMEVPRGGGEAGRQAVRWAEGVEAKVGALQAAKVPPREMAAWW